MSESKRKRGRKEEEERPAKRVTLNQPTETIKVSFVSDVNEWVPVLATSPGLSLPAEISLKPYKKLRRNEGRSSSEVLLHSAARSNIDYTVVEEDPNSIERLLTHYIGIYDPDNKHLQLVQARAATIRGTPRFDRNIESVEEDRTPNELSTQTDPRLEFGTKKAKNALRSYAENAIAPGRHLSQSSSSEPVLDPAAAAVLSEMAASAPSALAQKEIKRAIDDARPGPKPNMEATTVAEVYPLEEIVGLNTLSVMTVRDWQDKVRDRDEILTKSRYVSGRVRQVVKSEQVRRIKALKYLLLLVQWYHCFTPGLKGVKKLRPSKEVEEGMTGTSEEIRNGIRKRFADGNELNKWHTSNLHLHICALALIIEDFTTDVYDLCQDLRLETSEIQNLFKHLGSTISAPTEAHVGRLSITKAQAAGHRIARLALPLKFPQPKTSRTREKRR